MALISSSHTNLKTFDIALKYLEGVDIDFTKLIVFYKGKPPQTQAHLDVVEKIMEQKKKFHADPANTESNEYFRDVAFETACWHLAQKAQGYVSFFDVACEIVEANMDVLNGEYEKFMKTNYPQVMLDHWHAYCDRVDPKMPVLDREAEQNLELFFSAYHYITGKGD